MSLAPSGLKALQVAAVAPILLGLLLASLPILLAVRLYARLSPSGVAPTA